MTRLTKLFLTLLALYQISNLWNGTFYSFRWEAARLELMHEGKEWLGIPTLLEANDPSFPTDFSSSRIAYWARKINPWDSEVSEISRQVATPSRVVQPRLPDWLAEDLPKFAARVERCGGKLVVTPVPLRHWIETGKETPEIYRSLLSLSPAHVLDLYTPLERHHSRYPSEPLFIPDGHWTSLGVAISAQALVQRLMETGSFSALPQTYLAGSVLSNARAEKRFLGSLLGRGDSLAHDTLYDLKRPENARTDRQRVVVFGTSFSQQLKKESLSFGMILAKVLDVPLVDRSFNAAGVLGSLKKAGAIEVRPNDLLVWEFPLKNLTRDVLKQGERLADIDLSCG